MKVKCIESKYPISLTIGKLYDVLSIENGWYRIIDDTDEDYLFPSTLFEMFSPNLYSRVLLKDGSAASIVEIFEDGILFLADIDKDGNTYTEEVRIEEILKVL